MDTLVDSSFDPVFSLRLTVDHGVTHLLPKLDVPIVLNMLAAADPARAGEAVGQTLRTALETGGQDKRVIIIASGGLSRRLPWPDWSLALSDDDRFLASSARSSMYDAARSSVPLRPTLARRSTRTPRAACVGRPVAHRREDERRD